MNAAYEACSTGRRPLAELLYGKTPEATAMPLRYDRAGTHTYTRFNKVAKGANHPPGPFHVKSRRRRCLLTSEGINRRFQPAGPLTAVW